MAAEKKASHVGRGRRREGHGDQRPTLTSCMSTSTAKSTPPIGVLNVAAMPAPPPAATSVASCQRETRASASGRGRERRADLDDGPLAPHRAPAADRDRRGQRLDDRHDGTDDALLVVDGVHDLGYAVSLGLRSEVLHEEDDDHAPRRPARARRRVPGAGRRVLVAVVYDRDPPRETGGCGRRR